MNNPHFAMTKQFKNDFYQSKYDYYRKFNFWLVVLGCLSSLLYFVSDCLIYQRFQTDTILPRFIILVPMTAFIFISRKVRNYKVMCVLSYVIIHLIMWGTIWAITFLPDKSHASEGFIIMQLLFFGLGFAAPFSLSTVGHLLLIADILLSNLFNHYANLDMMLSLGLPAAGGIILVHLCMQHFYMDHYKTVKNLEKLSVCDQLTDAFNRNRINAITESDHLHFTKNYGENVCVMMFDIDYFKKVNDTYGHIAGDKVLQTLCSCVQSMIPEGADLIRWGGEEFVLILPHTNLEMALELAENLRKKVESLDTGVCPITISVGVSQYNGVNYKDAIDVADKALYIAKESGRNCVKFVKELN